MNKVTRYNIEKVETWTGESWMCPRCGYSYCTFIERQDGVPGCPNDGEALCGPTPAGTAVSREWVQRAG